MILLCLCIYYYCLFQLITLARDVENELLTQVIQAERVNENKFS